MVSRGFAPQVACRPGCPWCRPPSCEQVRTSYFPFLHFVWRTFLDLAYDFCSDSCVQNIFYIRKEGKGDGERRYQHLKKHAFPAWMKNGDVG